MRQVGRRIYWSNRELGNDWGPELGVGSSPMLWIRCTCGAPDIAQDPRAGLPLKKLASVLGKLLRRLQPRADRTLHEKRYAARRSDRGAVRSCFAADYYAKYPKAIELPTVTWERLVGFFDLPAKHWKKPAHRQRDRGAICN